MKFLKRMSQLRRPQLKKSLPMRLQKRKPLSRKPQ